MDLIDWVLDFLERGIEKYLPDAFRSWFCRQNKVIRGCLEFIYVLIAFGVTIGIIVVGGFVIIFILYLVGGSY